ncbi:hypothetical protein ABEF92_007267 [Exophiala dermatitidis]|uniref:Uncharacterized protein n=1 Tax=Exophiala dermatitidis (strain ATCC 34100 / CBS 525.76 / NIH/UT8656) TaxID=858893 RepID=H6BXT6_EXODN|nr:uncharacterized protein HMPREF1120_05462 [Exophiala dermatitidis NIH/UT8656]EHY57426.1 hypothetical protein HMPREF1120_05462 [Exophiala dermatitidis NIH/UT8656]
MQRSLRRVAHLTCQEDQITESSSSIKQIDFMQARHRRPYDRVCKEDKKEWIGAEKLVYKAKGYEDDWNIISVKCHRPKRYLGKEHFMLWVGISEQVVVDHKKTGLLIQGTP